MQGKRLFGLSGLSALAKYPSLLIFFLVSCTGIETGESLRPSDIENIRQLHLLDPSESIYQFYSPFSNRQEGNFFTDKRIAAYYFDDDRPEKNFIEFAFYSNIRSIDTCYYAGLTYSPYMVITRTNNTRFKVFVEGSKAEIREFFEGAMALWKKSNR